MLNTVMLGVPFKLFELDECERLILRAREGLVLGGVSRHNLIDTRIRTNRVYRWDDHDHYWRWWELFRPYTQYAPAFLEEPFQISCYSAGEHYNWHQDGHGVDQGRSSYRSLTLTATLQNAEGAAFEFESGSVDLPQGWAVIFPSNTLHRATAPRLGERWSFTIWCRSRTLAVD